MAFGDPNWVSLLPGPPAESAREAANKGALAGYQLGQLAATRSALQGIDPSDQASINKGVGALMRAGAFEAANSALSLNSARVIQQAKLPVIQALGQRMQARVAGVQPPEPQAAPQGPPDVGTLTPDQHAHVIETLDAMDAIDEKISSLPYAQRRAALAAEAPTLHDRGMDPALIQNFDPTDENIARARQDHATLRSQIAAAQQGPQSRPGISPGYSIADANLRDPIYSDPAAVGIMKNDLGIDPNDTLNRDVTITAPMRTEEAKVANARALKTQEALAPPAAPFGAVNVADPTAPGGVHVSQTNGALPVIQNTANAEATGKNIAPPAAPGGSHYEAGPNGSLRIAPTSGGQAAIARAAEAQSGGSAAGSAPYELVPGLTDPVTGAPLYRSKADLARGAIPQSGASPGQGAVNLASAQQLTADRQSSGQLQAQLIPLRTAYGLISSGQVTLGPGSEAFNTVRKYVTNIRGLDQTAAANYDEVHKYLVQIANQRASQFGAGTNEKLAQAAAGSPNVDMSNLGAAQVLRVNIALARAEAAKPAAYGNGPPEGYASFAADYGRKTDPRAFMLDMMTTAERRALYASISKASPLERAAFANGVSAAEAAGYFTVDSVAR